MTKFEYNGATLHLLYNGYAYFELGKLFPDESIVDVVRRGDLKELSVIAARLIEEGEAVRRARGLEAQSPISADELLRCTSPKQALALHAAVFAEILEGISREELDTSEPEDMTLMKMNKKKE